MRRGLVQGAAWLSRVRCGLVGCGVVPRRLFIAHFISIEGSSVRLGYSRNIPHSMLLVLVLGISCRFTTA